MSWPVEILLATYNGERFLREQIESILQQTYEPLTILARDDGSTDGTVAILEDYARRFPDRFRVMPVSPPTGSAKLNFRELMAASTGPYVGCADQDDVWLPEKIARSMAVMQQLERRHSTETPLLVFTDLRVVDDALNLKHASLWRFQPIVPESIHHFRRLLTQNVVTGSTMLMNRPLVRLAARMPARAYMHDWWVALVACAIGAADYLREQTVLYRQHGSNVLGAVGPGAPMGIPKWRYHEKRREQWEASERQAEAMLEIYRDELPAGVRRLLESYVRCETAPGRLARVWTLLVNGFLLRGLRPNLAILWYLWDMKAAKRGDAHRS